MTETSTPETFTASYIAINDALFEEAHLNNDVDFNEDTALLTIYPADPDSPADGIKLHASFTFDPATEAESIYDDNFFISLIGVERVAEDHPKEKWNESEVPVENIETMDDFIKMAVKQIQPKLV